MFTGLVQAVGRLEARERRGAGSRVKVAAPFPDLALGESIAVNGACLTVEQCSPGKFTADISPETQEKTTLGRLAPGSAMNLERALSASDRLGGHFVSGHVDAICQVVDVSAVSNAKRVRIRVREDLMHLIAVKGSLTLDGVSLTVNALRGTTVELMLVPHTLLATTLSALHAGQDLNLEVDLLARYVERCMNARS